MLPANMQLLGPDGLPFGSSAKTPPPASAPKIDLGPSPAPAPAKKKLLLTGFDGNKQRNDDDDDDDDFGDVPRSNEEIPDFDKNHRLQADRPTWDFAAASGREGEVVWGAVAPRSAAEIVEWSNHMRKSKVQRVLGIFTEDEAAARSPDGTAFGYMKSLVEAGFDPELVALVDPTIPDSREVILKAMREAYDAKKLLCVHCVDGEKFTGLVLADWLLTDYIQNENADEAVKIIQERKRVYGVGRLVPEHTLQNWVNNGHWIENDTVVENEIPVSPVLLG
jgi:hypothetical protein